MHIPEDGELLRIYVGETDRWEGRPLYEAIVHEARREGLAGATVLRGLMGFGRHSRVHTASVLRLSQDLPVVIEIADAVDKIEAFLPIVDRMVTEGMVTVRKIRVLQYRGGSD
jgi:PII-like signaling protein